MGERRFDGIRQAAGDVPAQHETVHDDLYRVLLVLFQCDLFAQIIEDPVHAHAGKAAAAGVLQQLDVLALLAADDGRKHLKACALRHGQHLVDDLVYGLTADLAAALRAVRRADARPEQTQIVIDLRDGTDGGTRVFGGRFLVDGDGGGKSLDQIHIRLVHLPEKLADIGRKRLDIAAAPLGIDRVEGQRGLAGARQPRKDAQRVAWDLNINIFQIVFSCAFHEDGITHSLPPAVNSFLLL